MRSKSILLILGFATILSATQPLSRAGSANIEFTAGIVFNSLKTGYGTKSTRSPKVSIGTYLHENEKHYFGFSYTKYSWKESRPWEDPRLWGAFISRLEYQTEFKIRQIDIQYRYQLLSYADRMKIFISPSIGVSNIRSDHARIGYFFDDPIDFAKNHYDRWNTVLQSSIGIDYSIIKPVTISTEVGYMYHFDSEHDPFPELIGFHPESGMKGFHGTLAFKFRF